jgi:prevent-host-death family protein
MEEIDASEAKNNLSELLEHVAKGRQIAITEQGVPIAVLRPYDAEKGVDTETIIKALLEFRENNTLSGLNLREMFEEDRR